MSDAPTGTRGAVGGALREAAFAAARGGALPVPAVERLLATERVAAAPRRAAAGASPRVRGWRSGDDPRAGLALDRPSVDRAIVTGFLRHGGDGAVAALACRSQPEWARRGDRYGLWADDGGVTLAAALLAAAAPAAVLRDAGLAGDLIHGAVAQAALARACATVAALQGAEARAAGTRLIALFAAVPAGAADPVLAHALLAPWSAADPPRAHIAVTVRCLAPRLGDPAGARWAWAARAMPDDGGAARATLRRWVAGEERA